MESNTQPTDHKVWAANFCFAKGASIYDVIFLLSPNEAEIDDGDDSEGEHDDTDSNEESRNSIEIRSGLFDRLRV